MKLKFPIPDEAMPCPHCRGDGDRAFNVVKGQLSWADDPREGRARKSYWMSVAYCRTCGGPIVRYGIGVGKPTHEVILFPTSSTRPNFPVDVKSEDADLAKDYNEAVACEPKSLQATMLLLGLCAERILIEKAGLKRGDTLGTVIKKAMKDANVPAGLRSNLEHGFVIGRNQAGHVWVDAEGKSLPVDEETVEHGFTVIGKMFDYYYLEPETDRRFKEKMSKIHKRKQEGEKAG